MINLQNTVLSFIFLLFIVVFVTEFIRPICLSPEVFVKKDFTGHHPTIAGWGRNAHKPTGMYYDSICELLIYMLI